MHRGGSCWKGREETRGGCTVADMDINKRKQLFRGRESGQRRGFTKETEGGEKKRHSVLSSTSAVSCPAVKAS